jgi:hypothetical protein
MAGRAAGFRHNEDTRKKIQAAQIIKRLHDHIFSDGDVMTASQVNAAKLLLAKTLPDLQAITLDGNVGLSVTLQNHVAKL